MSVGNIGAISGFLMEKFTISDGIGIAWGAVYTPYNVSWKMLDKELFLNLMYLGSTVVIENMGMQVTSNWTASSYYGDPVTVYNMSLPYYTFAKSDVYYATWYVGEDTYISLLSMLDRETTSQIINTARIV